MMIQIATTVTTLLLGVNTLLSTQALSQASLNQAGQTVSTVAEEVKEAPLAVRELSLENRHKAESVNDVFAKNILLNLAYLEGSVTQKSDINWDEIVKPFEFSVTLEPGKTFAYHDDVLAKYEGNVAFTTNTHFHAADGYLFSGFLYGDGVCHLASIINWAAQDAGLEVEVTKLHSIAHIPDIPDEYGVSIYTVEGVKGSGANNNLYITNNQDYPVEFRFIYQDNTIRVELHRK